jgi:uncharacterized protein (DUF58 family)
LRKYLDPALLSRLQGLELKARLVVEGTISGMHKSPFKGFSVEFAEHKSYFQGDDIRYIDWKIFARTGKYFIKQFEEDTNLKSYILVDTSKSMAFGKGDNTKLSYAGFLAVCMSYLMLAQRDSVGLATFSNEVGKYIPPRNGMGHLHHMVGILENLVPSASTNICLALKHLASHIKRRGLIVLISDLIDDQDSVLRHLKYVRRMKHELIVLHLVHPDELSLPYRGTTRFRPDEYDGEIQANPDSIRTAYRARVSEYLDAYKTQCWQNDIGYHRIVMDKPVEESVLHILAQRRPR